MMAKAIISRNVPRVKTGIVKIHANNVAEPDVKSITIPDLVGAKNAIIFEYAEFGSVGDASPNGIVTICIEDGKVFSATMVRNNNDYTDYIDLSYISFDATTGTISIIAAGASFYKNAFFRRWTDYKYIIY